MNAPKGGKGERAATPSRRRPRSDSPARRPRAHCHLCSSLPLLPRAAKDEKRKAAQEKKDEKKGIVKR